MEKKHTERERYWKNKRNGKRESDEDEKEKEGEEEQEFFTFGLL